MRDHSKRFRRTVVMAVGLPFAFVSAAVAAPEGETAAPPSTLEAPPVADGTVPVAASGDEPSLPPPPTSTTTASSSTASSSTETSPSTTPPEPSSSSDDSGPSTDPDPTTTTGSDPTAVDSTVVDPGSSTSSTVATSSTTVPDDPTSTTVAEPVVVDVVGSVKTAAGTAVAGAWVQVTVGQRAPVTAITDAEGGFTVAVPEGPAVVRIESAGSPALPFNWGVGPVTIELDADVVAAFRIPDPVVLGVTAIDATAGSTDAPLVGATVGLANRLPAVSVPFELVPGLVVTAESYPWTATTAGDGTAALALFPTAEPVTVFAAVPGPAGVPNVVSVEVPSVLDSRSLSLTLGVPVPPIQYTGLVRSADGRPIPNVWMHLGGVLGVAAATSTDATGRFALDVAAGPFSLSLISAGTPAFPYSFSISGVELDLASDTDHELVVPDPVTISIGVSSAQGRPWTDAYAGLDDFVAPRSIPFELLPGLSVTATSYPWSASTDPDGVARLRLLPSEGPLRFYAARVSEAGFPSSAAVEDVDGRDDRRVEITLG